MVTVNIRANTTSTQENIKQKKAATAMPGAIRGNNFLMKNPVNECPSVKAVSSNSLGMADIKLTSTQMDIGKLNKLWASAIANGELIRSREENS